MSEELISSIEKPRRMWALAGDFAVPGHPVFDAAGQAIGVLSLQQGSEGVEESGDDGGLGALLAAGDLQERFQLVALPLEEIHKQYLAAEKRADEAIAEHRKAKEQPAEGETPPENPPEKAPENPPEQPAQPDLPK